MAKDIHGYELVDFGEGRKLERFGSLLLDRPCVAAESSQKTHSAQTSWKQADLRFGDDWRANSGPGASALRDGWTSELGTDFGTIDWSLRATPAGHVGLFPEHRSSFDLVLGRGTGSHANRSLETERVPGGREKPKVLNLFAYTGFGSVQSALAGYAVTHVDSSRPSVQWARQNLEQNLARHPLLESSTRFLVDDALAFANRELRRGNRYDLICLDPPAYGHGPQGKAWRIDRDLPVLLEVLLKLLSDQPQGLMLCGHSDSAMIQEISKSSRLSSFHSYFTRKEFELIYLRSATGRNLNFGYRQLWLA
jgi:23S rRNA (cytosine1962-C5)-methyltransferase